MGRSYDRYFATGLYNHRYPAPNRRVMARAARIVPRGGRFLDYGAGEGRYCIPLVVEREASAVAFDISATGLAVLTEAAGPLAASGRVTPVGTRMRDLEQAVERSGRFDAVMATFGVLGHVRGRRQRVALLASFRAMLNPGGRVLVGLPNAARRFRREQRLCQPMVEDGRLEPGDILYSRTADGVPIELYYHLYRPEEVRADAVEAGFVVEELTAESLLPEHSVVTHPWIGRVDDAVCGLVPLGLAYGFLATLRPR